MEEADARREEQEKNYRLSNLNRESFIEAVRDFKEIEQIRARWRRENKTDGRRKFRGRKELETID